MVEEEPGEDLNGLRVAPAGFPLETFDALIFEVKYGFSLLAKKLVVGGTAFSRQFYKSIERVCE